MICAAVFRNTTGQLQHSRAYMAKKQPKSEEGIWGEGRTTNFYYIRHGTHVMMFCFVLMFCGHGWVGGWGFTTASLHELISLFIHLTFSRGWWSSWWAGVARLISCSGSCCWLISPSAGYPDLAQPRKNDQIKALVALFYQKTKKLSPARG